MKKFVAANPSRPPFEVIGTGYLETPELTAEHFVRIRDFVANLQHPRHDGPLNQWYSSSGGEATYSSEGEAWRAEVLANIQAARVELANLYGASFCSDLASSPTLYSAQTNDVFFRRSRFDFIKVLADDNALGDSEKVRNTIELIGLAMHLRTNDRVAHYGNELHSALAQGRFDDASAALKRLNLIEQEHQWLLQCSIKLNTRVDGDETIGTTPMDLAEAAYQVDTRQRLTVVLLDPVLPNRTEFARWDAEKGGKGLLDFVQAPQLTFQESEHSVVAAHDLEGFCRRINDDAKLFVSQKSMDRTGDGLPPVVGYTLPMVSLLGMLKSVSGRCSDGGVAVRTAFGNTALGQSINRASDDTRLLDQLTYDLFLDFWRFLNPEQASMPRIQVAGQSDEVPMSDLRSGPSNGYGEPEIPGLKGLTVGTAEWYRAIYQHRREQSRLRVEELRRRQGGRPVSVATPVSHVVNAEVIADTPIVKAQVDADPKSELKPSQDKEDKGDEVKKKENKVVAFFKGIGRSISRLFCCFAR